MTLASGRRPRTSCRPAVNTTQQTEYNYIANNILCLLDLIVLLFCIVREYKWEGKGGREGGGVGVVVCKSLIVDAPTGTVYNVLS